MEKKFIKIEKAIRLEDSIGFLSSYKPTEGEIHHIGSSLEDVDEKYTKLLRRLGELNLEKEEILKEFMKIEKL